jgi:phage tail protein X
LPLPYFFTILRRSFVFWLGVRLALPLAGALGSETLGRAALVAPTDLLWLGPGAVLFLTVAVAIMVLLDLRSAREHILLANLGMAGWAPPLVAGLLVLGLELSASLVHAQLMVE